jgi:hypothetical protein
MLTALLAQVLHMRDMTEFERILAYGVHCQMCFVEKISQVGSKDAKKKNTHSANNFDALADSSIVSIPGAKVCHLRDRILCPTLHACHKNNKRVPLTLLGAASRSEKLLVLRSAFPSDQGPTRSGANKLALRPAHWP